MGQSASRSSSERDVAALHEAIRSSDCAAVQRVLERVSSAQRLITTRRKATGRTALHEAAALPARPHCESVLQLLLDGLTLGAYHSERSLLAGMAQVPPNASVQAMRQAHKRVVAAVSVNSTKQRLTPLMVACASNAPDNVRLLLACGADAGVTDRDEGATALHHAARAGSAACIDLLLDDGLRVRHRSVGLFGEVYSATIYPLRLLPIADNTGWHAFKDARAVHGMAALHYAALHGPNTAEGRTSASAQAIRALLRGGADPTALACAISVPPGGKLNRQCTALHCAVAAANLPAAVALVEWSSNGSRRRVDLRRIRDGEGRLRVYRVWRYWRSKLVCEESMKIFYAFGFRPYDLARRQGLDADFLELLDPARPLQRRRRRRQQQDLGPQALVLLAAAAARLNMLEDLERVEKLQRQRGYSPRGSLKPSPFLRDSPFFHRISAGLMTLRGRFLAPRPESPRIPEGAALPARDPSGAGLPYPPAIAPPARAASMPVSVDRRGSYMAIAAERQASAGVPMLDPPASGLQHGFGSVHLRDLLADADQEGTAPDSDDELPHGEPRDGGDGGQGLFDLDGYLALSTGASGSQHAAAPSAAAAAGSIARTRTPRAAQHNRNRSAASTDLAAQCPICFDAEPIVPMGGCGHEFCGDCLRKMLSQATGKAPLTCPLCRGVVLQWGV